MIYQENINKLKRSMKINEKKQTGKHTINVSAPFLPFKTRKPERPKFKRKFIGVAGEVSRIINSKRLVKEFNMENYIDRIVDDVQCESNDERYLKELIKDSLIDNNGDIKVFHANIFNYIQLTEGDESVGERDIAKFLYSLFFANNEKIKDIFIDNDNKNIVAKLVLSKLNGLEDLTNEIKYVGKLDFISNIAIEDFNFMTKNKEFFLRNFPNLLAYYYFYYITQLSVKMNKKFKKEVDYSKPEEIYYLLDWEKPSKSRKSDVKGYKYIKAESENLLINMNLIEHLNFLFGVKDKSFFEIKEIYDNATEEEKVNYLETIEEWIKVYRKNFYLEEIEMKLDFEALTNNLEESLAEKIDKSTMSRYALSIEEIGKAYFLKRRGGKYGYMLNITQEMILLIIAVSIKDEKVSLKSLFNEIEKRGVFLDRYSKDLITDLLIKLNLIDKKSDSGDAQYVKAIL